MDDLNQDLQEVKSYIERLRADIKDVETNIQRTLIELKEMSRNTGPGQEQIKDILAGRQEELRKEKTTLVARLAKQEELQQELHQVKLRNSLSRLENGEPFSKKFKKSEMPEKTIEKDITNDILSNIYCLVDKVLPREKPQETNGLPVTFKYEIIKKILDEEWVNIFPLPCNMFGIDTLMKNLIQKSKSQTISNLFSFKNSEQKVTFGFRHHFLNLIVSPRDKDWSEARTTAWLSQIICTPVEWYLKNIQSQNEMTISYDMAQSTTNSSSCVSVSSALQPDMRVFDKYSRIGIIGQHKLWQMQAEEAKEQLTSTYFPLVRDLYKAIDRTFSYTATGNHVQMYFVEHKHTHVDLRDLITFNLAKMEDRLKLFVDMMILIEIIDRMFELNEPKKDGALQTRIEFDSNTNTVFYLFKSSNLSI